MNKFLTVVGQLKFRGTSILFRLPQSPVKRQGDPFSYPSRPTCPSPIPVSLFPIDRPSNGDKKTEERTEEEMEITENATSKKKHLTDMRL